MTESKEGIKGINVTLSKIEVELEDSTLGVSNPKYITRQAEILSTQREKLDEVKGKYIFYVFCKNISKLTLKLKTTRTTRTFVLLPLQNQRISKRLTRKRRKLSMQLLQFGVGLKWSAMLCSKI